MPATTRLNTGLFVSGEHKIVGPEGLPLPAVLVEIEDGSSLLHKQRIAGKDPSSMPPGTESIFAEPAPNGGSTDLRYEPLIENFLPDVRHREAREGESLPVRQFTCESFYLNDETGGKSGPYARLEAEPPGRAFGREQIAYATC